MKNTTITSALVLAMVVCASQTSFAQSGSRIPGQLPASQTPLIRPGELVIQDRNGAELTPSVLQSAPRSPVQNDVPFRPPVLAPPNFNSPSAPATSPFTNEVIPPLTAPRITPPAPAVSSEYVLPPDSQTRSWPQNQPSLVAPQPRLRGQIDIYRDFAREGDCPDSGCSLNRRPYAGDYKYRTYRVYVPVPAYRPYGGYDDDDYYDDYDYDYPRVRYRYPVRNDWYDDRPSCRYDW